MKNSLTSHACRLQRKTSECGVITIITAHSIAQKGARGKTQDVNDTKTSSKLTVPEIEWNLSEQQKFSAQNGKNIVIIDSNHLK